ncbi:CDP-diacylglycerol--glycerol-3-phosphate 3-phosphatidyltransferase [Irineochytrium annulatum]|nr:CDP-diacylglycerol--glycerol-3-phosphate 3-phosphatidyltransferase [Irineochytrium annulatum]
MKSGIDAAIGAVGAVGPLFRVLPKSIKIIHQPASFYQAIRSGIESARSRVLLSTLYIGQDEHELIDCLRFRLKSQPDLRVHVLVDYLRGTRPDADGKSTLSLLHALAREYPRSVDVSMFEMPGASLASRLMPARFNEAFGLMHMKAYAFDDSLIMSGANLSRDYFTNRQDRYILFNNCEGLANYFHDLASHVSTFSHKVDSQSAVAAVKKAAPLTAFEMGSKISEFCRIGKLGIRDEDSVFPNLVKLGDNLYDGTCARLSLGTAYLNISRAFEAALFKAKSSKAILVSSPEVLLQFCNIR